LKKPCDAMKTFKTVKNLRKLLYKVFLLYARRFLGSLQVAGQVYFYRIENTVVAVNK